MRLDLTHKFLVVVVLAIAVALSFPPLLERLGVSWWGAAFLALGVAAAVGWLLSGQITSNFRTLRACTDLISRGDLTAEIDVRVGTRFPDETTDLARSVRGMQESLSDLVEHVQLAAEQVARASDDLSNSTQSVNATTQELASTMDLVSNGAARQQTGVESTSQRIHEIADAIRSSSGTAQQAFGFAAEARERATSGVEVSREAMARMQSLFDQSELAGKLVVEFDRKIRSVHRITEVITAVAEKTHLLSLNASIEAARAGDAGRGFSVVAEEIRKLAESAGGSAEQIEVLIDQVEDESARISEVMRNMGEGVGEGRESLDSICHSLEGIQHGVQEAAQRTEVIFHQADGQVGKAERCVDDVDAIATIAAENARAIEDMRRALVVQARAMEEVVAQARRLTATSQTLEEVSGRFRTR